MSGRGRHRQPSSFQILQTLLAFAAGARSSHLHEFEGLDRFQVGGSCREVRVPELELDMADARPLAQELGRHGVPQSVRVDSALDPDRAARRFSIERT